MLPRTAGVFVQAALATTVASAMADTSIAKLRATAVTLRQGDHPRRSCNESELSLVTEWSAGATSGRDSVFAT